MCGLFSYTGTPPDRRLVSRAISCLRHRGSQGFGYWWRGNSGKVASYRESEPGKGFSLPIGLEEERGVLIAHWRYATTGSLDVAAMQPIIGKDSNSVLAHNGQFLLPSQAGISDTQIVFRTFVTQLEELTSDEAIGVFFNEFDGAFSLVCYINGNLLVARDTHGFRPLFIGQYLGGNAVSSETTALEILGCENIFEVPAGHWAKIEPQTNVNCKPFGQGKAGLCAFEHIYFHSREGRLAGQPVSDWRTRLGSQLGLEQPVNADLIAPVPHSGCDAAKGYADRWGYP